jgi:hypothetical protein
LAITPGFFAFGPDFPPHPRFVHLPFRSKAFFSRRS